MKPHQKLKKSMKQKKENCGTGTIKNTNLNTENKTQCWKYHYKKWIKNGYIEKDGK
jgi:hypothetical protein